MANLLINDLKVMPADIAHKLHLIDIDLALIPTEIRLVSIGR